MVSGYNLEYTSDMGSGARTIIPKAVVRAAPTVVKNTREGYLWVRGIEIYNLLPDNLRSMNTNNVDVFKTPLDVFLSSFLYQPTMTGWVEQQTRTVCYTSCPCSMLELFDDKTVDINIEKP